MPEMGVSYAGQKDRHAVTTQRFSVHLPKRVAPDLALLESDEFSYAKSEAVSDEAGDGFAEFTI